MAIEMTCAECGSADVRRDAWAAWDVGRQVWVLANVFDDGFCEKCERDRPLEERVISPLIEQAR